jgi:hypothetical protein
MWSDDHNSQNPYFISFSNYITWRGSNVCKFQGIVATCDDDDDDDDDDKDVVILKQLESTNNSICCL